LRRFGGVWCEARGSASAHVLERPHEQGVSALSWCLARADRLRSSGLCDRTGEAVSAVESVSGARFSRGRIRLATGVGVPGPWRQFRLQLRFELLPFGVGVVRGSLERDGLLAPGCEALVYRQFGSPGLLIACASFELCDRAQFRWLTPVSLNPMGGACMKQGRLSFGCSNRRESEKGWAEVLSRERAASAGDVAEGARNLKRGDVVFSSSGPSGTVSTSTRGHKETRCGRAG